MIDLGTIQCDGVRPGEISGEIISRITERHILPFSMVQVTLDGLSREHGKGPDMRDLVNVRERLLDLKIRARSPEENRVVPLQQDVKAINYLEEFATFLDIQQIGARQKEYVARCGHEVLTTVMERHREDAE
jgi:hypothetical protein